MNEQRLSRVRRLMEEQGLEQIIVSATASVYYLTGLWVSPMERMLALYITQKDCALYANELFGLEPQSGLELILHSDGDEPTAQLSRRLLPGKLGVDKFWPSKFLIALLEARGEPFEGQQAVADVVFNRMLSPAFPDTLDEVIYQEGQFSTAERVQSAEPTEAQYIAISTALSGPSILPLEVVFFSQKGENDNVWGTIGGHVFCYPYYWEGS